MLKSALARRKDFLRILSLILTLGALAGSIAGVAQIFIFVGKTTLTSYIFISLCFFQFIIFGICYGFIRKEASDKTIDIIAVIMVFSSLVDITLVQFYAFTLRPSFMILPMLIIFAGLNNQITKIVLPLSLVSLIATIILLDSDTGNVTFIVMNWFFSYSILCWGTLVFSGRLAKAASLAEEQAGRLDILLAEQQRNTNFGATISTRLSGVTTRLDSASREHASSSQEQVAAVTQVTVSLEELSETAHQITGNAQASSDSSSRTLSLANAVKSAGELARATSQQGAQAVTQSIESAEAVRNKIELLGQKLLLLTAQTGAVGNIIDIIQEISEETHLLALNASIESAGGAGGSNNNSLQNSRFAVIANEVKNLADRSREATEEVRHTIETMRGAVAGAVLVAEEAKKETAHSLVRNNIAGTVIHKLNDVIVESANRASEILIVADEVKARCEEIRLATGQQHSANQQILMTMRSIAQASQESARAVNELSQTVSMVNLQVVELNSVLARSQVAS